MSATAAVRPEYFRYDIWNRAFAEYFFNTQHSDEPVYLQVDAETLQLIAPTIEVPVELAERAFIIAAGTLLFRDSSDPFEEIHGRTLRWRDSPNRTSTPPPFLALLGACVLAASRMERDELRNIAPTNYYRRLNDVLQLSGEGMPPGFEKVSEYWELLRNWLDSDNQGALGICTAASMPPFKHITYPISQCLLREHDRARLPQFFEFARVPPYADISAEDVIDLLVDWCRPRSSGLSPLAERLILDIQGTALKQIARIVAAEARHWDGPAKSHDGPQPSNRDRLYLCCVPPRLDGRVRLTLRCRYNPGRRELPEDDLTLFTDGGDGPYFGYDEGNGWSSPIRTEAGELLDAASLDWSSGLRLREWQHGWQFRLLFRHVRVFTDGSRYGLPNLVEADSLPTGTPFFLAADSASAPDVEGWGSSSCDNFRMVPVTSGLAADWSLYRADAARDDGAVREKYPVLRLPSTVVFRLVGGIKVDRRNTFFSFAPPRIVLDGSPAGARVFCNQKVLAQNETDGLYDLPDNTPTGVVLTVEAHDGSRVIGRHTLTLAGQMLWPPEITLQYFDAIGERIDARREGEAGICGALVEGVDSPRFPYFFTPFMLESGRLRDLVFVGRHPGQIARWPRERLPSNWSPVWAIPANYRGRVQFCGPSLAESAPASTPCGDRSQVRRWKEVLWWDRMRIRPPAEPALQALWRQYRETAHGI